MLCRKPALKAIYEPQERNNLQWWKRATEASSEAGRFSFSLDKF